MPLVLQVPIGIPMDEKPETGVIHIETGPYGMATSLTAKNKLSGKGSAINPKKSKKT